MLFAIEKLHERERSMKTKSIKNALSFAAAVIICASLFPAAYAHELIVGGSAVGIQVNTKGVLVAGLTEVETDNGVQKPAEAAGILPGDVITTINGQKLRKASQLIEIASSLNGRPAQLTIQRGGTTMILNVQPAKSVSGQWMMGMWLRDSISGVGTVTFCDPESGIYGALGHSINDTESGAGIEIDSGSINEAEIASVVKGEPGTPGELNGCADMGKKLGTIDSNTEHGIYGKICVPLGEQVLETGLITTGPASILCTVNGSEAKDYSVEINRIYKDAGGEHVMLTVTDSELIARTGGIVQGMSGSPIIQNGKLVGAVTHVFVNDPAKGYGVSIQDMLCSAGLEIDEQAA